MLRLPPSSLSASAGFVPRLALRAGAAVASRCLSRRRVLSAAGLFLVAWWLFSTRLISDCNEQSGHVFAVMPCLLEGGTAALRCNALSTQANSCYVRVGVGALDAGSGIGLVNLKIAYYSAFFIVQSSEKGSCTQKATKTAIG